MTKYDIFRLFLNLCELIAFLSGMICFRKIKSSYWKWFVVYLGLIVIAEFTGEYLLIIRQVPNQWIYTWFVIPLEYLFLFWIFFMYFKDSAYQYWPLYSGVLYTIAYIIDMAYLRFQEFAFSSFSYMLGCVLLLLLIIFYFVRLFKSDSILQFKEDMMFWVCTGLLVFFLGSFPFYGLWNTLVNDHPKVFNIYWMVQIAFDCVMYLFFACAFVWGKLK